MFRMRDVFGRRRVSVEIEDQVFEFDVTQEEPDVDFEMRLMAVIDESYMLAEVTGIGYTDLVPHLLVIDGWSWNDDVFRAPIWMHDHREIPICDALEIRGLEWLTGTSLEIKSGHCMV